MKLIRIIHLLIILAFVGACKDDPKIQSGEIETPEVSSISQKIYVPGQKMNISVLIDLSDRINPEKYPSPAMEFYMRDIGYLESVAKSMETHILDKKVLLIDDKIQVFIDPEPSDQSLNQKISELKVHFTKDNVTKESIINLSKNYGSISKLIYESAINDNNYVGSNVWGFFKNKVEDYCIDDNHRNILVILTDGYLYHKDAKMIEGNRSSYIIPQSIKANGLNNSNWQKIIKEKDFGFIAANDDLSNLEVLVLGLNPVKGNPYEQDVLNFYWSKWFDEMKVKNYEIKQADLPTHMDKIIQDFILR